MTSKDTADLRNLLTLFGAELHANSRAKGFWEDRDKILGTPQGAALVEIASLGLATTEAARVCTVENLHNNTLQA